MKKALMIVSLVLLTACGAKKEEAPPIAAAKLSPDECYNKWYEEASSAAIKDLQAQGNKGPYDESELVPMGARMAAQEECGVK